MRNGFRMLARCMRCIEEGLLDISSVTLKEAIVGGGLEVAVGVDTTINEEAQMMGSVGTDSNMIETVLAMARKCGTKEMI